MEYGAFLRAAERGELPPVALLHGPEPFLLEDAVARITRALFPDAGGACLSREVLGAKEAGPEGILRAARTLPFLATRRLVVVRGADALGPKQSEPLAEYVRAPNPSTVLLLLAAESLDASHWLVRAVGPAGTVAVRALSGAACVNWLRARAAAEGIEMDARTAELVIDLVGEDLTTLLGEVRKAALAADPPGGRVTEGHVRAVIGERRVRHVFELMRALEARETGAALGVLQSLLDSREDPLGLLAMLAREARLLWQVVEWQRAGRSPDEIARRLRRPPAAAASLQALGASLAGGAPAHRLRRCVEAERRLKLGSPPRAELALLVSELCAG
jgi:DNA polymerase-3 subunit delta